MAAGPIIEGYTGLVRIGRGGLGDVYRATQVATGAEVAVKVLRDVSDTSVAWHRVRRELTALRALSGHANVVQIVDVLELGDAPALVMEFAPGGSVADLMEERGGTLTPDEAVFVGRQVAAALVSAHTRGIVHRDIKPQNLLVDAAGQVKLCDFGIAALTRDDEYRNRTNAISMRYASPEDLEHDEQVGPASDVYSLGATLLHVVHGAPPTLKDRLAPWVPPGATDARVAALDRVIARCLHPHPTVRPTAQALLDSLDGLALGAGDARVTALPVVERTRRDPEEHVVTDPDVDPDRDLDHGRDRDLDHGAGLAPEAGAPPARPEPLAAVLGDPSRVPSRPRPVATGRRRGGPVLVAAVVVVLASFATLLLWPRDAEAPVSSDASAVPSASSAGTSVDESVAVSALPPVVSTTAPAPTASVGGVPLVTLPRPADLAELDELDWDTGEVGDCLLQVPDDDTLAVVDCLEPHDLQRVAEGSVEDLDAAADLEQYDRDVIEPAVTAACTAAFAEFVGRGLGASELGLAQRQPSAESWESGDRDYTCYLGVVGFRITGDARRSGW